MYTIIIPAYNEEKTVRKVLKIAAAAKGVGQIILIDDGSTDNTAENSKGVSPIIEIISHQGNIGKGAAIRTALAHVRFEAVVFLDADLTNISSESIASLVEPILNNRADFVKASFTRARGRVTEIAVKPMMQILFPDNYFEQPISGQFAARLSFLKTIKIVDHWGLDIGILLDAISSKLRIEEVFIGELKHKSQSEQSLAKMSEQVLYTMIQKAGLLCNKYKLILFHFDESLLKNYSMESLMKYIGKEEEYAILQGKCQDSTLLPFEYYSELTELLVDVPSEKLREYAATLELRTYAKDVIDHLKRRRFKVGIIGMHFNPIMKYVADNLNLTIVESIGLKVKGSKLTGEMTRKSVLQWFSLNTNQSYLSALHRAAEQANSDAEGTIVVTARSEALPLMQAAGLSVAYRSKDKLVKKTAAKTISILPELLILVE